MDDNPATSSLPPHNNYAWHFNTNSLRGPVFQGYDVRVVHSEAEFSRAEVEALVHNNCGRAMYYLGRSLHPVKDIMAHQDGNDEGHHAATGWEHITGPNAWWLFRWTRPDKMHLWPKDVESTHAMTLVILDRFLRLPCNPCVCCLEPESWLLP